MNSVDPVIVHSSQSPAAVQAELVSCLRRKAVNHKFLYATRSQTEKWLKLHCAYSPSRTESGCEAAYDEAFEAAASMFKASPVHVVSLGCGGSQKDERLLNLLANVGASVSYSPVDVSYSMVVAAYQKFAVTPDASRACFPVVCDLGLVQDFSALLPSGIEIPRLITFFGMIPNFEPASIMPRLAGLVRSQDDVLLFSANLAPPPDYEAGVKKVFPLYDNELTREWLLGFLAEVGIRSSDGFLEFSIETDSQTGLQRIAASFIFAETRTVILETDAVEFEKGSRLRVFFSYRHTCDSIRRLLSSHSLQVEENWLAPSQEEGVFLARSL